MMTAEFIGDDHVNDFMVIYGYRFEKGKPVEVEDNVGLRLKIDHLFTVSGEPDTPLRKAAPPLPTVAPIKVEPHKDEKPAGKVAASSGHSEGGGGRRR